jgi:ribosome-associated protein
LAPIATRIAEICSSIQAGECTLATKRATKSIPSIEKAVIEKKPAAKRSAKLLTSSETKPRKKPATKAAPVVKPIVQPEPKSNWQIAAQAADAKQAKDIKALDLREVTSFTDTLIICGATSSRQAQTISDEVEQKMKEAGDYALSIEGYTNGEWILLDFGDCVVNVFTEKARAYYDLERLWRDAKPLSW